MRRTFPQKGQPVPSRTSEHETMTTQAKQASLESNRMVRTSAAVIGLAVSVGTCGLPIHSQGDQAVAAEPSVDPAASNVSKPSFETAAAFPGGETEQASGVSSESSSLVIKHTVQEGQTLWDVARFYGTDASMLASVNGLSLSSVLRVGQTLTIPTDTRIAQAVESNDASVVSPGYYGLVSSQSSDSQASNSREVASSQSPVVASAATDAKLKEEQDGAVDNLRQSRERLRLSLNALKKQPSEQVAQESVKVQTITSEAPQLPSVLPSTNEVAQKPQLSLPVQEDQKVAFRGSNQLPESDLSGTTHRVGPGDTLSAIARSHGISMQQLISANRISNPNYIFVGQTLVIPQDQNSGLGGQFQGAIAAVPTSTNAASSTSLSDSVIVNTVRSNSDTSRIAAAPSFLGAPRSSSDSSSSVNDSSSRMLRYNHVDNLKFEIDRLREKLNNQSGQPQTVSSVRSIPSAVSVAPSPAASAVNPELKPAQYSTRVQEIRDRLAPNRAQQTVNSSANVSVKQPQVVAAAPLGAENYDPIKSRLGQTVSPELPPLGSGSEYLPGAPSAGYIWPTKGVLTSGYGWRWGRMHKGIDIAGPVGTPIVAASDGVVSYAGWNSGGYGYLVEIQHADGSLTLYAHNNRVLVQVGQQVAQGQQIAEMGSTGYSTGPHLHFEVHPSGKGAVNPIAYLPRD